MKIKNAESLGLLIIEDSDDIQAILKTFLKSFGFLQLYTALDGREALERIPQCNPDLIFCDIHMEPMDGIAFLQHLRGPDYSAFHKTPVVMITGENSEKTITEVRDLGVSGYIVKPFNANTMHKVSNRAAKQAWANKNKK